MPAHTRTDPATAPATIDPAGQAGWLALSAAMTDHVPDIADRDDLIVKIAPGAGHGSPACFLPDHATIEINGTHLDPVDPATATPHRASDRARYAPTWGLLTHEAAHARHSTWTTPPEAVGTAAAHAAELLEESRIEAAQIRRRPADRHWLRAATTAIILADTRADDPDHAPPMTRPAAAQAAALLLARVDAGILTGTETAPVHATIEKILGADTLTRLRELWQAAHRLDDHDTTAMLDLGARWCQALGLDPNTPAPDPHNPTPSPTPSHTPAPSHTPGSPVRRHSG